MPPQWTYRAVVVKWLDGDTCDLDVHVWPGQVLRIRARLDGINTPETRTKDRAEKAAGKASKDYAIATCPHGNEQIIHLVKKEKYGRWLVRITLDDGRDLAAKMIALGHGKEYHGEAR